MKATVSYSPGDKIFAKVKGHPHWPSRINLLPSDVPIPKGKYPIFFYGTHEVYFLAPKDIFPYDKFKHKYGIKRNKAVFQAGLEEIEKNPDILLYGKDPQAESFLAQFYTFQRSETVTPTPAPTNKRQIDDVVDGETTRPAKRSRSDVSTKDHTPLGTSVDQSKKSENRSSITSTEPSISDSNFEIFPNSSEPQFNRVPDEPVNHGLQDGPPIQQKRVSSLRLRIRKNSRGHKLSPNPQSPVCSPSTPGSNTTLEAKNTQPEEPAQIVPTESLKITIRQNSKSSLSVLHPREKDLTRPVVPVTPTRNMAINVDPIRPEINRRKSTAVVTPLRRSDVLPELSDDSSDDSDEKSSPSQCDKNLKPSSDVSNSSTRPVIRPPSLRLKKKSEKRKTESSEVVTSTLNESDDDASSRTSWSGGSWSKTPTNSNVSKSTPKMPEKTGKSSESSSTTDGKLANSVQEKLQYLKDLSTEARLILIDRAIKSSLTQGHEDITTCIDLLEMLDKMPISLPVMAKCWSVIDTIRKCRRYKKSLEVKIAAHKVFNKFLQLYATADKNELDLAHAELVKHQQLYARQHSMDDPKSAINHPYTGPKSMAELLQVSSCSLPERRRLSGSNAIVSSASAPVCTDADLSVSRASNLYRGPESFENSQPNSAIRSDKPLKDDPSDKLSSVSVDTPGLSIQDIPLPEEPQMHPAEINHDTDCAIVAHEDPYENISNIENIEDYFELLDEYKEPVEDKLQAPLDVKNLSPTSAPVNSTILHFQLPNHQSSIPNCTSQVSYFTIPAVATMSSTVTTPFSVAPTHSYQNSIRQNSSTEVSSYPSNYFSTTKNNPSPHVQIIQSNIEATPPQSASRAYVPHSLHPSTDPPPPYRPYIPSRCDLDDTQASKIQIAAKKDFVGSKTHSFTRPVVDLQTRSPRDRDDRAVSLHAVPHHTRDFRSPPHRARSPHALPHPLAHYQRYLNSALVPDDIRDPKSSLPGQSTLDNKPDMKSMHLGSYKPTIPDPTDESNVNRASVDDSSELVPDKLSRKTTEDLDTRIERLFNFAARKSGISSTKINETEALEVSSTSSHKTLAKLGSPPPPPPPLPASQRILFTHKPQHSPARREGAIEDCQWSPYRSNPVPIVQSSKQDYQVPHTHPPNDVPVANYDDSCPPADHSNSYTPISPNYQRPIDSNQHHLPRHAPYPTAAPSARHPEDRHKFNYNSHQNQFFRRSINNRLPHQHNQFNRRPYQAPSTNYPRAGFKGRSYSGRNDFVGRDFRNRQRSGRENDRNLHSMSGV